MELKDVVYVLGDRTITKTRVLGVKDVIEESRFDDGEKQVKYYLVRLHESNYHNANGENNEWVTELDHDGNQILFSTLEDAQRVMTERIQAEVIKELERVAVVDLSGIKKDK